MTGEVQIVKLSNVKITSSVFRCDSNFEMALFHVIEN